MKQVLNPVLLLIPFFVSCQNLPIIELKNKGVTQEEIDKTISLNGKNGVSNYFLIVRQKKIGQNPNYKLFVNSFDLYTPKWRIGHFASW